MNKTKKCPVSLLTKQNFALLVNSIDISPKSPFGKKGTWFCYAEKKEISKHSSKKCFVSKQYFCRGNRDNRNSGGGYGVLRKHLAHPNDPNDSNTVAPQPQNVTHSKKGSPADHPFFQIAYNEIISYTLSTPLCAPA